MRGKSPHTPINKKVIVTIWNVGLGNIEIRKNINSIYISFYRLSLPLCRDSNPKNLKQDHEFYFKIPISPKEKENPPTPVLKFMTHLI